MAIFTSREAAEAFAYEDPFVLNGVVRDWRILEWYEDSDSGADVGERAPARAI